MKYRKASWIYITMCVGVLTAATAVCMFSMRSFQETSQRIIEFDKNNIQSVYLRVRDVYGMENQKSLSEFFAEKDALKRMKAFCAVLNKEFNYLEFDTQSLLVRKNCHYKDEFRIDYGTDHYGENDNIGKSLKSIQIGSKAYDAFGLENQVEVGRGFDREDYKLENKEIPTLLGYEYSSVAKVGDVMKFNYLSKDVLIRVIGFLRKDTSFAINNNIYYMDQYVIIPFLDAHDPPKNAEEQKFQNILYSQKSWGYIKVADGENYYDYQNRIDELCRTMNMKYILEEGHVFPYIRNVSNTLHSSKGFFLIASVLLFLTLSTVFAYVSAWNFQRNKKVHAIHLLCGCSFDRLKLRVYLQIGIQFLASFVAAALINWIILGRGNLYGSERMFLQTAMFQTLVLSTVVMVAIMVVLNRHIERSNIYASIQKED